MPLAPFIESEVTPNVDEGEVALPLLPQFECGGGEKLGRVAVTRPP